MNYYLSFYEVFTIKFDFIGSYSNTQLIRVIITEKYLNVIHNGRVL